MSPHVRRGEQENECGESEAAPASQRDPAHRVALQAHDGIVAGDDVAREQDARHAIAQQVERYPMAQVHEAVEHLRERYRAILASSWSGLNGSNSSASADYLRFSRPLVVGDSGQMVFSNPEANRSTQVSSWSVQSSLPTIATG